MMKSIYLGGAAFAVLALCAEPAIAQELDEIIVTAQKREQSLVDVPISVAVFSGEDLEEQNISNFDELQLITPNYQVTQTGIGTQMYIRGIGSGNDPAFEQSVGQFIDGVSYGRARLSRAPFFDLQRVEVLRGPQSVLFGKNTTAGALSLVTARPTDTPTAKVSGTYTPEFDHFEAEGAVSGPLGDSFGGRVAFRYLDHGGFVYNGFKDRDEPKRDEFGVRGTLEFTGHDRFDATLKVEAQQFDSEGREIEVVRDIATQTLPNGAPLTYATALAGAGLPGAITNTDFDFVRDADAPEYNENDLFNTTLTTNTNLDFATLTTVTAYVTYDRDELADLDFTNANILTGLVTEEYEQFSQEVRLASNGGGRFDWIAGAFYQDSTLNNDDITGFGPGAANLGFAPIANIGLVRNYQQDTQAIALFGEATWHVSDRFRLIGGLRWTKEDKEGQRMITARTSQTDFDAPLVTDPVALAIVQGPLGVDLNNPGAGGHDLNLERSESVITPSFTAEFDVNDDVMLFASYREGFKGGGFDVRGNSSDFFEFEDEQAESYEAGFKSVLLGGRANLNATAYFAQYSNLQISQFDGTIGFNVGNAGETEIAGIDIDGRFAITDELSLSGGVSYLDFEYTDFRRGNCAFGETPDGDIVNGVQLCDYTGRRGRFTPEWSASGRLDYVRPIFQNFELASALTVAYTGEHNVHDNLDPLGEVDGYTLVDLRVGVGRDNWEIAAVGRNLLDEDILTFAANVPFASRVGANTQYAVPLLPRAFGVQAKLRF